MVAAAAFPEQSAHLGEFAGRAGRVEAEPAGGRGQRQRLRLHEPQQRGVGLLEVAQGAQRERTPRRRSRPAAGLPRGEPPPQVRVESLAAPVGLAGRRRGA
ncbi:hypothetical protein AB0M97_01880 [Streptomyces sp. NPDC051207]|uniref:hypothetical protein n=1 Tax=Streptomyces sp. NPDC051207 TaxID=3154641 RepID=UPI003422E1AD